MQFDFGQNWTEFARAALTRERVDRAQREFALADLLPKRPVTVAVTSEEKQVAVSFAGDRPTIPLSELLDGKAHRLDVRYTGRRPLFRDTAQHIAPVVFTCDSDAEPIDIVQPPPLLYSRAGLLPMPFSAAVLLFIGMAILTTVVLYFGRKRPTHRKPSSPAARPSPLATQPSSTDSQTLKWEE
jgi:hypothetical protein